MAQIEDSETRNRHRFGSPIVLPSQVSGAVGFSISVDWWRYQPDLRFSFSSKLRNPTLEQSKGVELTRREFHFNVLDGVKGSGVGHGRDSQRVSSSFRYFHVFSLAVIYVCILGFKLGMLSYSSLGFSSCFLLRPFPRISTIWYFFIQAHAFVIPWVEIQQTNQYIQVLKILIFWGFLVCILQVSPSRFMILVKFQLWIAFVVLVSLWTFEIDNYIILQTGIYRCSI